MKKLLLLSAVLITWSANGMPVSDSLITPLPYSLKAGKGEMQAKGYVYHDANNN